MLSESSTAASSLQRAGHKTGHDCLFGCWFFPGPLHRELHSAGEGATQRESKRSAKPTPHPSNRSAHQLLLRDPRTSGSSPPRRSHSVQQSRRAARHRPHLGLVVWSGAIPASARPGPGRGPTSPDKPHGSLSPRLPARTAPAPLPAPAHRVAARAGFHLPRGKPRGDECGTLP